METDVDKKQQTTSNNDTQNNTEYASNEPHSISSHQSEHTASAEAQITAKNTLESISNDTTSKSSPKQHQVHEDNAKNVYPASHQSYGPTHFTTQLHPYNTLQNAPYPQMPQPYVNVPPNQNQSSVYPTYNFGTLPPHLNQLYNYNPQHFRFQNDQLRTNTVHVDNDQLQDIEDDRQSIFDDIGDNIRLATSQSVRHLKTIANAFEEAAPRVTRLVNSVTSNYINQKTKNSRNNMRTPRGRNSGYNANRIHDDLNNIDEIAAAVINDASNIYKTVQQTNKSVKTLNDIWYKTMFGLITCVGFCFVLFLVPIILSLIWMALGFELTTEPTKYRNVVWWFFTIWITFILCFVLCLIVLNQKMRVANIQR